MGVNSFVVSTGVSLARVDHVVVFVGGDFFDEIVCRPPAGCFVVVHVTFGATVRTRFVGWILHGNLAEEEGFEPPVGCPTSDFKSDTISLSDTLPWRRRRDLNPRWV